MRKLWPLTLVVMLAACTPTAPPSPSVSPAPSYTCSPSGGTPSPCTQSDYEKTQERNQLAAEAEQVYRRYFAEQERIMRAGNVTEATPEMKATLAEDALDSTLAVYRDYAKQKVRFVGGEIALKSLAPNFDLTDSGSTIMVEACRDASTATIEKAGRKAGHGAVVSERAFLRPVDGVLKIVVFYSREQKAC